MNELNVIELDRRGGGWRAWAIFGVLSIVGSGLVYPLIAASAGAMLFPAQAQGSLIERDGQVVGSALMAQAFNDDRYFSPRPSAANYTAASLAGSNWAPSNPALRERAAADSARIAARDGVAPEAIPVELISASGSGIDPHLSPGAAVLQAARVARARGLPTQAVIDAIDRFTEARTWGVLGQPRVNVLALNLWLDESARAADHGATSSPER